VGGFAHLDYKDRGRIGATVEGVDKHLLLFLLGELPDILGDCPEVRVDDNSATFLGVFDSDFCHLFWNFVDLANTAETISPMSAIIVDSAKNCNGFRHAFTGFLCQILGCQPTFFAQI
jgi:hypothetical protein